MKTESPRVLLVVPTYNERANLPDLVSRFFAAVPQCHLLVVDDESPDGTADLCTELQHDHPGLHLLRRTGARGLGRAYIAGLRYGLENGYDVIGTMDADLSHNPDHLRAMLPLTASHDVVVGSRYIRDGGTINWRIRRIVLSWLANRFAAWLLRIPAHDMTSGFRLYRRQALAGIPFDEITSNGYSFLVELLYRLHRQGATIAESPIIFYDRTLGESKLASREIYIGAFRLIRLRLSSGLRKAARPSTPLAGGQNELGAQQRQETPLPAEHEIGQRR
ncbi:MAG TPA: polyprenol monophosphomannose synthase [Thermoanaerobaculia bacterium]|nr:polyprenol monophosphomannose synthase [Thermoanaerobaculia bacterium]